MSSYELDDDLVRKFLDGTSFSGDELEVVLREQIPIPVPTGIGAVVRTDGLVMGGTYVRWAHDNATHSPWVEIGNHEKPYRTDEIGRIVKVLSEGVKG